MVGLSCSYKNIFCMECSICSELNKNHISMITFHDIESLLRIIKTGFEFSSIIIRVGDSDNISEYEDKFIYMETFNPVIVINNREKVQVCNNSFIIPVYNLGDNILGRIHIDDGHIEVLPSLFFNTKRSCLITNREQVNLTDREGALLKILLKYRERYISSKDIQEMIWGQFISPVIVRQYIRRLKIKLQQTGFQNSGFIQYRKGYGYKLSLL